jgi:Sec-independent protein translocase protein TatA
MVGLTRQAEVWHLIVAVVVLIFGGGAYVGRIETKVNSNEKRIDQNASLLSMGNRYTKEDHILYSASVDEDIRHVRKEVDSVKAEITSQLKEIKVDINAIRQENVKLLEMIYQEVRK